MTAHTHFHHKTWLTLGLMLGLVLCGFASWRASARVSSQPSRERYSQSAEHASKGQALAGVLNTDGTVKPGVVGSFDVNGYQMQYTEAGAPRFVSMAAESDDKWDGQFGLPGTDGSISAVATIGSDLYVGGNFTIAGNAKVNGIAKWNGTSWVALGSGLSGGPLGSEQVTVNALAVSGGNLYVGGNFTTAGGIFVRNIAKWDGSAWNPLGSGVNDGVFAIAVSGNDLYVGGVFSEAGGNAANNIAKWNGNNWAPLSSGTFGGGVRALALSGSDLYVGGFFSQAGGIPANNIAKWNGSSWAPLGSGVSSINFGVGVEVLAVSGSNLYAGGDFFAAGGTAAKHIAKWDGSSWAPLGSGLSEGSGVGALAVSGGDLYVGGDFKTAGGTTVNNIAKWNGSSWASLSSGVAGGSVRALSVNGSELYVGGVFSVAGDKSASRIAKWNGVDWTGLGTGNGALGPVECLLLSGNDLYVGGSFAAVGNILVNNIAKWNGNTWTSLGSGVSGPVRALALRGSDLYVGGFFSHASGTLVNNIARWNGSSWAPLGSGIENGGGVTALAVSGNDLYVGGGFQIAGGVPAKDIAKWNGSSWAPLGSGMNNGILTLAANGSDLYAGGFFTTAGGVPVNRIAKWNGNSWSPLGSGLNSWPRALVVSGNELYVGGDFTMAGGASANGVAKWNGSSWTTFGGGVNGTVSDLAFNGTDLYVIGGFTTAGVIPAKNIAKWDGSNWTALGSGLDKGAFALAVNASDLYVGGAFAKAGNKPSAFIGRYSLINAAPSITATSELSRQAGTLALPSHIANVSDPEDAANTLTVTINGAATATSNGIAITNLNVDAAGKVTANIAASANAFGTTFTLRVRDTGGLFAEAPLNIKITQPTAGPGLLASTTSPLSAQRPGSVLIYNVFTSSAAAPNQQNTRLSLTNTHPLNKSYVHLFFVDGASCSVADAFVCLTPNQTTSFLASDLDPGTSGYVIAVAVDALGCPSSFNHLIGDEFVKFSSGHAANLGAEAVTAIAGGLPFCDGNSSTTELRFDGLSYSVLPTVLAVDNLGSRADGNDTLLILNRIGGSLATGAATLGSVFGILYDDAEAPVSFSFAPGTCQLRNVLSGSFPRTVPRYEQFIPAGRTGWLKVAATNLGALTGAVLNFNPNALTQSGAFNQGHNLHKLTTTNTAAVTIPVFPPGC